MKENKWTKVWPFHFLLSLPFTEPGPWSSMSWRCGKEDEDDDDAESFSLLVLSAVRQMSAVAGPGVHGEGTSVDSASNSPICSTQALCI